MDVADMDPTVSMAMTGPFKTFQNYMQSGQTRSFMQPSMPTMKGCPRSVVARAQVLLGSDSGGLVFVPDTVNIKAGESVTFKNNVGFPHNVVFDEDAVPEGVDAAAISKEDYLNAPGETVDVKFTKAG